MRDGELKGVFRDLQTAYIALVCNPFYEVEGGGAGGGGGERKMITSRKFIAEVRRIGEGWVPSSAVAAGGGAGEGGGRERRDTMS